MASLCNLTQKTLLYREVYQGTDGSHQTFRNPSRSVRGKPVNPPEWLCSRATQYAGSLLTRRSGSAVEPLSTREAFKPAGVALQLSRSVRGKAVNPPEWLCSRATQRVLMVWRRLIGFTGDPISHVRDFETAKSSIEW